MYKKVCRWVYLSSYAHFSAFASSFYEDIYEYIFKTNPKTLISSHQDNTVNQINARYKHAYASFIDTLEIILGA